MRYITKNKNNKKTPKKSGLKGKTIMGNLKDIKPKETVITKRMPAQDGVVCSSPFNLVIVDNCKEQNLQELFDRLEFLNEHFPETQISIRVELDFVPDKAVTILKNWHQKQYIEKLD